MRKRRRLADKLTIMVCAVLVAVSTFFYAPMDVSASNAIDYDYVISGSDTSFTAGKHSSYWQSKIDIINDDLIDDAFYLVQFDYKYEVSSEYKFNLLYTYGSINWKPFLYLVERDGLVTHSSFLGSDYFVLQGNDFENLITISFDNVLNCNFDTVFNYVFSFNINSITQLTGEESSSYQQGYNAGYSAGEQVGESNGYSNGYSDGFEAGEQSGYDSGFQAGQDSVDTQSYYDMGYSAGYDSGYLSGYDVGYDDGYDDALKALQSSSSVQQNTIVLDSLENIECIGNPFYVSSYGFIDMEEYQSGVNGYFYNTVPGTYNGITTLSYNIPFWTLNNNSYPTFNGDTVRLSFTLYNLFSSLDSYSGSATLDANLMSSKIREVYVVYKGKKYFGNYSTSTSFCDFDFLITEFVNSDPHTLIDGDMTINFVVENSVTVVTNSNVTHYVSARYTPKVNFNLGRSGNSIRLIPYVSNDRVSANIQSQTDIMTNGFNSSQGNSVNNDFSSGLNEFETAEDSLFATATTGLKDFTFFDIQSVPAMVTGMSFVGSIMSGWFTQAGGASGVGIVLSILFSIMLVAMVLGLYRWYQSKGGKD